MSETQVIEGAEAWSADGGTNGALVLHGFTGNPSSMRGLAEAFAAAGFAVELPRLPGHGTTVDEMLATNWTDWSGEVQKSFERLASRCDRVVVAGLSMGGTLTIWAALEHPEVAGIVCVNPATKPDEGLSGLVQMMIGEGNRTMPGIGSDVADPEVTESAYDQVPLEPLASMFEAVEALAGRLGEGSCPLLLMNSPEDHVVSPENADFLAEQWGGPVERVTLDRSYHVATIDFDRDLVAAEAVAFANRVC